MKKIHIHNTRRGFSTRNSLIALLFFLLSSNQAWSQWCTPIYGNLCSSDDFINNFSTTGGMTNITNNNSGCNGNANNYIYYPGMTVTVTTGATFNISVQSGPSWSQGFRIWIDYNNDFDFVDVGEDVWNSGVAGTQVFTGSITVPLAASPGNKRMRVRCAYAGVPLDPCATESFGEVEDYNVQILTPAPNDIGVSAITAPNSGCNLTASEIVSIQISGYGTNTQTGFNVGYRVNGGAPVIENVGALAVAQAQVVNYNFVTPANLGAPGVYTIKSWTQLVGDGNVINDTTIKVVTGIPSVSTFPYCQDFESGPGGWTSGGANNTWAFGTPAKSVINSAGSGVNSFVTGGLGVGTYSPNDASYVLGPCFDFSSLSNPWFSVKVWWYCEDNWDGAVLQSSTDFGASWQNVGNYGNPLNWYNYANLVAAPGGGNGDGWSGTQPGTTSGGWVTAAHQLTGLAGNGSVRLRIAFGSDASVEYDGVAIDDICIGDGPVPDLGPDQLMCGGDTIILDPGIFTTYEWTGLVFSPTDTITAANAGTIWVRVTDAQGFYGTDTVNIALSNPMVNLGPDSTICPDVFMVLDAGNPGATYDWNTGDTSQTITVNAPGTYIVEIMDSVGCYATDTMELDNWTPPILDLGPDTTVCYNEPVVLDGGPGPFGTTYQWSTGATTQIIVVTSPGVYVASVTTPGGCAAVDTVEIFNLPNPALSLGPDRVECGPYVLDAGNPGDTYQWSTGANTQTISLNMPGTYIVTVTNGFNCTGVDSVIITMGTPPTVNLGPDIVICNGVGGTLDAGNPGCTYLWSTGETTQSILVTTPGTYICIVTTPSTCAASDTIVVGQSNTTVNLGPDAFLCGNNSILLDASNPTCTFNWSTGANTQTITVSTPNAYTVTVTDQLGCNAIDQINITNATGITAGITAPASGSLFTPIQFNDASTPAALTWQWDFGDGGISVIQNPTHAYAALANYTVTLIVHNANCSDTTTHTIAINDVIGVQHPSDITVFEIYPNPSDGVFNVHLNLNKESDIELSVTDLTGRIIWKDSAEKLDQYKGNIVLSGYSSGVYVLNVKCGELVLNRKLILE